MQHQNHFLPCYCRSGREREERHHQREGCLLRALKLQLTDHHYKHIISSKNNEGKLEKGTEHALSTWIFFPFKISLQASTPLAPIALSLTLTSVNSNLCRLLVIILNTFKASSSGLPAIISLISATSIFEVICWKNSAILVAASTSKLLLLSLICVGLTPTHSWSKVYQREKKTVINWISKRMVQNILTSTFEAFKSSRPPESWKVVRLVNSVIFSIPQRSKVR